MTNLPEQPEVETACPRRGADPTHESEALHKLSAMGYAHDDQEFVCSECENNWCHGVPIGESDPFDGDLRCENPRCETEWCFVHRIERVNTADGPGVKLHKKCPECYFFGFAHRLFDDGDLALVGYPPITGNMDGAIQWGYDDDTLAAGGRPDDTDD